MSEFITVTLDFMTQLAGGRGGIDHNVVQFIVAGFIWGILLRVAIVRHREDQPAREKLLIWGFSLGLGRELFMFFMAYVFALGLVSHDILHAIFPPLEHALSNMAMFLVAGAFLFFLRSDNNNAKNYIKWSLASVILCYLATFWWWNYYIFNNPTSKFGQTWCDWLFRINASFWLATAIVLALKARHSWVRPVVCLALAFWFLEEFLKIPDMALGEVYEHNFTPVRHTFHMLGILLWGYVYIKEQATERNDAKAAMARLAYHDILTGLPNRALLHDRLVQAFAQSSRSKGHTALLFLDLDRFKNVNDTWGHTAGDRLLQEVAIRLQQTLREGDTLARLGGDEFVILLPIVNSIDNAVTVAEKVIDVMQEPFNLGGKTTHATTSVGISISPTDGKTPEELLKHADMAMYVAKDNGRNCYHLFSEKMHKEIIERHTIENNLHQALANDELVIHYQPQINISTERVHGLEALVRWQHPQKGLLYPQQFIPVAEESGQIHLIGEWILKRACQQAKDWNKDVNHPIVVTVNISANQFAHPNFVDLVFGILDKTGLSPKLLELEITESALMAEAEKATKILQKLKKRGILLAIDDFGTGYSSLSYLKHFPIDRIKVDQSFIREITSNRDDSSIVKAILAMAESLELDVLAEGVESLQQLEHLRRIKCQFVQGYYFGRPAPASDVPWRVKPTVMSVH